jgi:glycosyltransferase involved in cell wall biosynthesis
LQQHDSRPAGYERFRDDRTPFAAQVLEQLPPCDVANLHWTDAFVDLGAFFSRLPAALPIVWTLHDMAAFTGGCHYDMGCGRWRGQCGACPQLGSDNPDDLSREVWGRKRRELTDLGVERMHVVAPSQWLAEQARESPLLGRFRVETIPYGLDTELFAPRDRTFSRRLLGIPPDEMVVLFVSASLENRRKGFDHAAEAIRDCTRDLDPLVVCVGSGDIVPGETVRCQSLGAIRDERLMSAAYSAADLCVVPSLQDNLPNTVLESMACGTPVVGSDVGGIPDMIRPGETGLLAPAGDAGALAECLVTLLSDDDMREAMSETARRVVMEEYALEIQANRYSAIYEDLLAAQSSSSKDA